MKALPHRAARHPVHLLMDAFTWFMDEARLELRNTMADPASKTFQELRRYDQSNFFSQAAGQDSLHFLSLLRSTPWMKPT